MAKPKKNKEYYAIIRGRVDQPTIFSSWGDAHPRVTGCDSEYKGFYTLEDARKYLKDEGVEKPKEVIKNEAEETTPIHKNEAFYAVAHGHQLGIHLYWYGDEGSKPNVEQVSGACHKHFRARFQAEAFIEDWKQSVAVLYCRAIKKALDQGFRPHNMHLSLEDFLFKHEMKAEVADDVSSLQFGQLSLGETDAE